MKLSDYKIPLTVSVVTVVVASSLVLALFYTVGDQGRQSIMIELSKTIMNGVLVALGSLWIKTLVDESVSARDKRNREAEHKTQMENYIFCGLKDTTKELIGLLEAVLNRAKQGENLTKGYISNVKVCYDGLIYTSLDGFIDMWQSMEPDGPAKDVRASHAALIAEYKNLIGPDYTARRIDQGQSETNYEPESVRHFAEQKIQLLQEWLAYFTARYAGQNPDAPPIWNESSNIS